EVIGAEGDGTGPAIDAGGERFVDIVEGGFGGGIAGEAQAEKGAAGFGLEVGFVAEERVLEGGGGVGGVEEEGLMELIAGEGGFADFEVRIGEVLADVG